MFIAPGKTTNRRIGKWANRRVFWSAATGRRFQNADMSAHSKACAFTLLEIMLAVAILGMMSLAIFRFMQSNMTALYLSSDTAAADAQYDGLRDLLTAHWQSLSPIRAGMTGDAFKLSERERDEIKWNCSAGPGVLTRYAPTDLSVTLRLQPENKNGKQLDLGLLRKSQQSSDTGEAHESWVPLIKNVTSLQISYFDSSTNMWVPKWPGGGRLPWLIKIAVGRSDSAVPWETVIPLRRTPY